MSPNRFGLTLAFVLSLALFSGCRDGSPAPNPPSPTVTGLTVPTPGTGTAGSFKSCEEVTAPEIDLIVDFDVTTKELRAGCQFGEQGNPDGITLVVADGVLDAAGGGIGASRVGSLIAFEGGAKDLSIGDAAYIVVGKRKVAAGNLPQGQGAVQVGDQYVLVTLTQIKGESAKEIERIITETLRLVAEKL